MSDTRIPHWQSGLTPSQRSLLESATIYRKKPAKGQYNGSELDLIATLAAILDTQEQTLALVASQLTQFQSDPSGQAFGLEALTQNPAALKQLAVAVLMAAPALAKFSKEATALLSELSEGELTTEQAFERLKRLVVLLAPVVALVPTQ